jgi:hypothetical protein
VAPASVMAATAVAPLRPPLTAWLLAGPSQHSRAGEIFKCDGESVAGFQGSSSKRCSYGLGVTPPSGLLASGSTQLPGQAAEAEDERQDSRADALREVQQAASLKQDADIQVLAACMHVACPSVNLYHPGACYMHASHVPIQLPLHVSCMYDTEPVINMFTMCS